MRDEVVVFGAGGPAGFNVAAAARDAGFYVTGYDSVEEHLPFARRVCHRVVHTDWIPVGDGSVLLPQPEALVRRCAEARDDGLVKYHGPSTRVLATVADKKEAAAIWHRAGLRTKPPVLIGNPIPDHLHIARDTLGPTFWLRANSGAGARGAILVSDLREAYHWIRLHEVRFGMFGQFVAEEYLPGRDYCWTAIYHEGERVASFSRERLEWLYPHLAPFSGRTGTPTRCRVVHDEDVLCVGAEAVATVDPAPHGVYCVDMREDADGVPRPTEINAGRWATTSPLYRAFGPNLVAWHVALAHGQDVWRGSYPGDDCYPDGAELLRHIDMGQVAIP